MLSRSTRITLPLLALLAIGGCRADTGDNEGEVGFDGVELIDADDQPTNSTGTFPVEPGTAVDGQGGEATERGMEMMGADTAAQAADSM